MRFLLKATIIAVLCFALASVALSCSGEVTAPTSVVTNDATEITYSTAILNGDLTSLGTASSVEVSFQWWASSSSYFDETDKQEMTTTGPFVVQLTDLEPDTTYHFRAKAVGNGTSHGAEATFKTSPLS